MVALTIARSNGNFAQGDLERVLARVYDAERLASMVLNRYPQMPVIKLFKQTISEATMAHFLGLHHVAVGGLIPVIEGAGRRLANERGPKRRASIKNVFEDLAAYAKDDVIARRIGLRTKSSTCSTHSSVSLKITSFSRILRDTLWRTRRTEMASRMEPTPTLNMEGRSVSTKR